jgi:Uma2 family endonuclease
MAAPEAIHAFPTVLSEEDYIELERKSGARYEFFAGETFPIPGPSFNHRIVTGNLNRHLDKLLKGGCSIGSADLRLKVEATGLLTYPDVFVVTGAMELAHPDSLLNPTMVAEVMSPRTELYDRTVKFEHYRQIKTLTTYLLVGQDLPRVELFTRRNEVEWRYSRAFGPHDVLDVPPLGITLMLADIYAGVEFTEASDFERPFRT